VGWAAAGAVMGKLAIFSINEAGHVRDIIGRCDMRRSRAIRERVE